MLVYYICGFFGYFTYGTDVKSNIMKNLKNEDSIFARIANIAMIIVIVVHFPVVVYPLRKNLD